MRFYFCVYLCCLQFYLSHWEKYNTGVLFLPWGYDASQVWHGALAVTWVVLRLRQFQFRCGFCSVHDELILYKQAFGISCMVKKCFGFIHSIGVVLICSLHSWLFTWSRSSLESICGNTLSLVRVAEVDIFIAYVLRKQLFRFFSKCGYSVLPCIFTSFPSRERKKKSFSVFFWPSHSHVICSMLGNIVLPRCHRCNVAYESLEHVSKSFYVHK